MKNTLKKNWGKVALCLCMANFACSGMAQTNKKLDEQVVKTMKTATQFMMDKVSYNGGFVWNYLPDMSRSWGEMEAKRTMVWIQPPGTPSVGHLLLDAYHATGDEYYYEAAKKVANALIWGQLECGGWNYVFDFAGENSLKSWYDTEERTAGAWKNSSTITEMPLMMMREPWKLLNSCFVCMWKRMIPLSVRHLIK